jgi:hypothetical protein
MSRAPRGRSIPFRTLRNVGLCGRERDRPQLMRMSLGGPTSSCAFRARVESSLIHLAGCHLLVLALLLTPLSGMAQTSSATERVDTTRVTRTLGGLHMTFMVTPPLTAPGDSAAVIGHVENQGADSVRIRQYPCYRIFHGVRFYWVNKEIVCQVGSSDQWLAPGAVYTSGDTLQLIDLPGKYELEYLAVTEPRIVLRLPIVLGGPTHSR